MSKKDEFYVEPKGGSYILDPATGVRRADPAYTVETVTDVPENSAPASSAGSEVATQTPVKSKKGD